MAPSSKSSRVRPSEIAADTKKNFIPLVWERWANDYPPYSIPYRQPLHQLAIKRTLGTHPPDFRVEAGDPVTLAINYGLAYSQDSEARGGPRIRVPFISAANEKRPGGDWETGCSGYEEKLCRRSNLSATLGTPWPGTEASNYPIPSSGGLLSDSVVVYRDDHYEKLENYYDLPVVSVPPTRWPKLRDHGTQYSFAQERDMIREKIRGALRICLYHGYDRVVVGDFGLGNGYRNPPGELAEIWRDVFLFDPELRGQFAYVVFAFEEPSQSTALMILDEIARKERKESKSGRSSSSRSSKPSSSSSFPRNVPTDMAIFEYVFDPLEIDRVLSQPDPRYALQTITC